MCHEQSTTATPAPENCSVHSRNVVKQFLVGFELDVLVPEVVAVVVMTDQLDSSLEHAE